MPNQDDASLFGYLPDHCIACALERCCLAASRVTRAIEILTWPAPTSMSQLRHVGAAIVNQVQERLVSRAQQFNIQDLDCPQQALEHAAAPALTLPSSRPG